MHPACMSMVLPSSRRLSASVIECDVTRGPGLDVPWPSHIKYTTMVGITISRVIRSQMDIVACILAPWSSGKDPDRYNGIRGNVTDTLIMMSSQWRTIQCSKPSGTTQVTTGYPWALGVLRLGYCDVTRGPGLDVPLPSHIKYTTMVGITISIVIRSQMDIVACLLAPWSSGKDPDRYIEGAQVVLSMKPMARSRSSAEGSSQRPV
jgi:hypothetical protein